MLQHLLPHAEALQRLRPDTLTSHVFCAALCAVVRSLQGKRCPRTLATVPHARLACYTGMRLCQGFTDMPSFCNC